MTVLYSCKTNTFQVAFLEIFCLYLKNEVICEERIQLSLYLSLYLLLIFISIYWVPKFTTFEPWMDTKHRYEPRHVTSDKMSVRPAKTRISLGIRPVWSESSLSAWRKLGSLATHWAHIEDPDQTGGCQADLSLRWAHSHFVDFVMSRLT